MIIKFYQSNADEFFKDTVDVDMSSIYQYFVSRLNKSDLILDAGCGSGRDTKAFIELGFNVEAFDASSELVKKASLHTGIEILEKRFEDVCEVAKYDAIWCCASLLHVPEKDLPSIMLKLATALKKDGIWYVSFKYGDSEREKDGRLFTDLNENRFQQLISNLPNLSIIELWLTEDNRPNRNEKWLNGILRKD